MSTATVTETPVFVPCGRCGGQGGFACYGHIANGVCFECNGAKGHWSTVEREERLAKRREQDAARRAAKRAAKAEAAKAEGLAFIAAHEGLADALAVEHEIAADLHEQALTFGSLSEKQVALAHKIAADVAERAARPAETVPEGRGEVTGEVVSIKWEEDTFAYHAPMVCKIVVADDRGFRLWGTAPKSIREDLTTGDRVAFTATLSAKEDGFGFFKRPTGAKVL